MLRDQLRELLAPVVAGLGYQLWELEYLPRSGGGMLRIYIDAASPQSERGISLDDCERVSRADRVLQLAHVTGPVVGGKHRQRFRRQLRGSDFVPLPLRTDEVRNE